MNATLRALLLTTALASLIAPIHVLAKPSDRSQPMTIDAGSQTGNIGGSGTTMLAGGVLVQQGTLDVRSEQGEIIQSENGEIARVIFTGAPVVLVQELEDGSPMTASADRIEYDLANDVAIFIGNYTIKTSKGLNSGQKMVYNLATGSMQAGGDGTRVRTVIQPRAQSTDADLVE